MSCNSSFDIDTYKCSDKGLILPAINEYTWSIGVRAALYMVGMLWCFLGIAIVSDTFMCGIEHITSKTRLISIPDPEGGSTKSIEVKVWNDTVANLTLLAFGTSAPEILLNVIEIVGHTFKAGELGPGTIVGSAAFNLFVITGICILSIPDGDIRQVHNLRVFAVTSCFGVFAYVWLTLVLLVITPERVDLWEAVLTLLMFPALISVAYLADKGPCCKSNKTGSTLEIGLDLETGDPDNPGTADIINVAKEVARDQNLNEDEAARAMAAKIARDRPKPSGWYRVNATRVITGGHRLVPKANHTFDDLLERVRKQSKDVNTHNGFMKNGSHGLNGSAMASDCNSHPGKAVIEFTTATCAVLENEGYVRIGVKRTGDMSKEINVGVETIDGTAQAVEDYKPIKQMLTFRPGESSKDVYIEIIDDDVWEPDEFFFVKLYKHSQGSPESEVEIGKLAINQVTIVNDDEPGKLEFSKPSYIIKESVESAQLTINRINGADGEVKVHWKTQDMSAVSGREYKGGQGMVVFKHGETSQVLTVDIYGIVEAKHEPNFQVQLSDPTGGAQLGKIPKSIVTIINDE
ncbi:sodium/calcium exchanger, partial [Plakobranchus ocellatus]